MRFEPKTEEQLIEMSLLPAGDYDFQVIEAKDRVSKSNNEMIELKLKIWDSEGKERLVFDYLLVSMLFKFKHFCDAVGLSHKYEEGSLQADDCIGKSGTVSLIIQKDKTFQYPDKNSVKDYIVANESTKQKKQPPFSNVEPGFDSNIDDLPF